MSDNDSGRYGDRPRRARHGRHSTGTAEGPADPDSDPWMREPAPLRQRREGTVPEQDGWSRGPESFGDGRAGRRRRADPAPADAPEPDPVLDRPRGRRRRPDPALDADRDLPRPAPGGPERERGRAAADPAPDRDAPPRGRRRRGAEPPPSPDRGSAPEDDAPPRGRRRRGTESQAGDPLDRSEPATGELPARGRRRASAEAGPEPRGRRSRRSRAAGPEEEPAELLDLPFEDDDDEDEPPRRRSQRRRESRSRGRRGDGRRSSRRRRRGRLAPLTAVLVIVLFVGAAGAGGYTLLRTYLIPPDFEGEGTGDVEVVVEEGDTGTEVGTTLEEAGVVASVRAFTNALRGEDADSLAPGTYRLRSEMSADAAVSLLLDPSSRIAAQVTIREGLRSTEILEETAKGTGIPLEELEAAYQDSESLDLPDYATEGAEGYLFPATYTFDPGADATEVLAQMVDRYKQVVEELELERRAEEADLTPNEVMSIAAIVQAETGGVEDMPEISSVVYNRLEADMELKMDSTCFYAIGEYGIAMNSDQQDRCEASDSEYKTYFRKGLPVGPIVSPGADAIDAALDPAETDWLFFVATDPENGVTEFAETEAEFWELVEKFNQSQQE